ncbi:argininosuccinate lyase [Magnetofaba australis]|uniref:Argininosuccinate lyase n=1 Tax=Magnetofaba australis IT-1 TaxID=1434232 RepID=A0A1Y2K724_9PROT|nr:argininosuccinate lyase [Magnetofaba australis]OSM06127.1 putative argininosuccinate lyase [Magnetofaba australis IT-1]
MTQSHDQADNKLWGGRFTQPIDSFVESFSASIQYDSRLYVHDIAASKVHCRMLGRQNIIPQAEAEQIIAGLDQVKGELDRGELPFQTRLEDIHMHVENRLKELIGPVAGKLHTARSRNDQVATDIRLYLREEVDAIREQIRVLKKNLLALAEAHVETIMPGFTHMQSAQPVTFGHHLMAYFEMLNRDRQRFTDLRSRLNRLPLGSAALAGTTFPVDRHWVAGELGFEGVCENSLDAVSDRDFAVEILAAAALTMTHLSRFSEELILWSSPAYAFIKLPDAFCTGSSIMPQKKNPDVPELVRGKTGRVYGALFTLMTLMKGLPLAYNRDMQEDKEPVFDAVDTLRSCLRVFADMVPGIEPQQKRMREAAGAGYATATDLADYLVRRNIPFREAHAIVGRIVRMAEVQGVDLDQLTLEQMQQVDSRIEADVAGVLTVEASVNARVAVGGAAFDTVRAAIAKAKDQLAAYG